MPCTRLTFRQLQTLHLAEPFDRKSSRQTYGETNQSSIMAIQGPYLLLYFMLIICIFTLLRRASRSLNKERCKFVRQYLTKFWPRGTYCLAVLNNIQLWTVCGLDSSCKKGKHLTLKSFITPRLQHPQTSRNARQTAEFLPCFFMFVNLLNDLISCRVGTPSKSCVRKL